MKLLLSIMSGRQWTPFYLDLDPFESPFLRIVDQIQRRLESRGVLPKMAYTERLHPKGVPFSGFKYMRGLRFHLLKYMKG